MSKAPDKKAPHTPADDPVSQFEADMKALEALVQQLEAADLPLDQSIALFEQGTQLSQRCRTALAVALAAAWPGSSWPCGSSSTSPEPA